MADILVGLVALLIGLMLCFSGYAALRVVLSLWGALIGFSLGSALATWINDDSYLATALGWTVGIVLALLFALLAYLYYAVGVILSLGAMGFALGTAGMAALGVQWDWVLVMIGVVAGVAVAALAIAADVPLLLLVVLSSLAGATVSIGGVMLLLGVLDLADLESSSLTENIDDHWFWALGHLALAVTGILWQLRRSRGVVTARQGWDGAAAR